MALPLLIIKTGTRVDSVNPALGDFEHWILRRMGVPQKDALTVAVHQGEALPPLRQVRGAVVTGSPAMVTDREPWSEAAADYLRGLVAAELPVLGICYGHQLLAHALGGEVGFHPGGREIGTAPVRLHPAASRDPLFRDLPASFPAHTSHSQTVLRPPAGSEVLGGNEFEPHHALRFAPGAWGLQFHPEFDAGIMRTYILHRREALEREGLVPEELLAAVRETDEAARVLVNFGRLLLEQETRPRRAASGAG